MACLTPPGGSCYTPWMGRTIAHKFGIHRLARESGVSVSHVSKIFVGKRYPSARAGKKLAKILGITLDRLYAEVDKVYGKAA